jgi:hypothetical protein
VTHSSQTRCVVGKRGGCHIARFVARLNDVLGGKESQRGMTPLGAADGLAEALVAQRQFLRGRFSSVRQPAGSGVDYGPTK